MHLGLSGHYFGGAYYPKGGGQVIADRVALAVEKAGGTVHLRAPVERILVDERGAACGVRLAPKNGEPARDVRAGVILSNADLKVTLERLVGVEHLPPSWVTRAQKFEMANAIFMTFLGVRADVGALGMRPANYWQCDDYDVERRYAESSMTPRACYVTSATLKDPEGAHLHAPTGVHNVEVMTLVPGQTARWGVRDEDARDWAYRGDEQYAALKARLEDDMVKRLDHLFPGIAASIVHRESATPVSHVRFTGASDGTGYGLAATKTQFMRARPGYRGPIANLYFCGASTRAGHGIVGAMASGRRAALRIASDVGRPVEKTSFWRI
jgi:phytoene dehydrogenase-like protein